MRPAWIEISVKALRDNIRNLKKCVKQPTQLMGVIKADGYGHGSDKVAELLMEENVNLFAVIMVEEGIELREKGFWQPILVLGVTPEEDYRKLIEYNLIPTIFTFEQADGLNQTAKHLGRQVPIHLKFDSGMGRLGFASVEESVPEIKKIFDLPNIVVEGAFSHLATADQIKDTSFARQQFAKFQIMLEKLEENGLVIPKKHLANSAATMNFPEMHLDMVRPGTAMYGLYPGPEIAAASKIKLYPAMEAKAKLVQIKTISTETPVGYGGTFVSERETLIGVVPMGYVDGVFRQLANKGEVLVRSKRCPIVGNICMDQFMVDLTDLAEVRIGDEVVLFGAQGEERILADEVGAHVGTISIEVVTRMGKRMPRLYVD